MQKKHHLLNIFFFKRCGLELEGTILLTVCLKLSFFLLVLHMNMFMFLYLNYIVEIIAVHNL